MYGNKLSQRFWNEGKKGENVTVLYIHTVYGDRSKYRGRHDKWLTVIAIGRIFAIGFALAKYELLEYEISQGTDRLGYNFLIFFKYTLGNFKPFSFSRLVNELMQKGSRKTYNVVLMLYFTYEALNWSSNRRTFGSILVIAHIDLLYLQILLYIFHLT